MRLRFLYIGSSDVGRDLETWLGIPGARLRWRFQHFGADVAAVDLGQLPVLLLADHRTAGTVLPIYQVEDLEMAGQAMDAAGWRLELGPVGTPEGPASVRSDGSGNQLALLQVDRPDVMDGAYADQANSHAVHPSSETAG